MSSSLSLSFSIPLLFPLRIRSKSPFLFKTPTRRGNSFQIFRCSDLKDPQRPTDNQQQLNLSVLRFTLGIPGLDESYLPRWIGYAFGSLLVLNHFVGSDSSTITSAQLRTEVVGLFLAAFSIVLPYLGRFLKGATSVSQMTLPEGADQIFIISEETSTDLREDLAWATYALLRKTNSISVLVMINDTLCVRGYWSTSQNQSKTQTLDWFRKQIKQIGFSTLKDVLYFPQNADSEVKEILPKGTCSVLVQPIFHDQDEGENQVEEALGFVLLASPISFAFSEKDMAWIRAIATKFRSRSISEDLEFI